MNTRSFSFNNIASVLVSVATVAVISALPIAAHAQTTGYIGDAYLVKAGLASGTAIPTLLNGTSANVGAGAALVDTGNLSPTVKQTLTGLGVSAGGTVGLGGIGLLGANDLLGATVNTVQTTSLTPSPFTAVNSTAAVTNLSLLNLNNLKIAGISTFANVPFVGADLVQSNTGANLSGTKSGSTTITNLTVNGVAASKLLAGNANVTVNGNGSITVNAPTSLTVYTNATVDANGNLATHGAAIGTLFLDEQTVDPLTSALTTNAIHLKLNTDLTSTIDSFLSGLPVLSLVTGLIGTTVDTTLNSIAGADVIVSSSTAGYNASINTAAPEPGSIALLGVGLLPAMGLLRLRNQRRNKKNAAA